MSTSPHPGVPFLDSVLSRMNGFLYRCRADKEFTMLELTSGFERCSGFPAADILENRVRSFASLIHPADGAAVDDAVVRGLENGQNWNINYRLLNTSGQYVWVHEDGGGIWNQSGALMFLEGAVFDIQHLYASLLTQFKPAG